MLKVEKIKNRFNQHFGNGDGEAKLSIKLECLMHGSLLYKLFFLDALSTFLFCLLTKINHAAGLSSSGARFGL